MSTPFQVITPPAFEQDARRIARRTPGMADILEGLRAYAPGPARVWGDEGRQSDEINPALLLDGCDDADRIRAAAAEHNEMVANHR